MNELRDNMQVKHKQLQTSINHLRETADEIGGVPLSVLQQDLERDYHFLNHYLMPITMQEGKTVYRAEDAYQLLDELKSISVSLKSTKLTESVAGELKRVLYGLHMIVADRKEERWIGSSFMPDSEA